jgi:hypothetical protein
MRWFIAILLALVLIQALNPWLKKLGLGKLPGDFHFRLGQRDWYLPVGSTVVLSFLVTLITHVL